jgi:hypothetical protein
VTIPETTPPTFWSPKRKSIEEEDERLDRAVEDMVKEGQWINDFIKRLNYTIEDIVCKK